MVALVTDGRQDRRKVGEISPMPWLAPIRRQKCQKCPSLRSIQKLYSRTVDSTRSLES